MKDAEHGQAHRLLNFEPFRLDVPNAQLWRGQEVIRLTGKALTVLCYLVERSGQLVTSRRVRLRTDALSQICGAGSVPDCCVYVELVHENEGNCLAVDTVTPRRGEALGATGSLLPVPSHRTGGPAASGTHPTVGNAKAVCLSGWWQVRHNSPCKRVATNFRRRTHVD